MKYIFCKKCGWKKLTMEEGYYNYRRRGTII